MRESIAAMALIQRQTNGQATILTQWNDRWGCFHLVGGHKHPDESFRDCAIREMEEELVLKHPADFHVDLESVGCATFTAWSNAAQQTTRYIMEVFRAELASDAARTQVEHDLRNRWVTFDEITAGRCRDGRPVSATLPQLLTQIGITEPSSISKRNLPDVPPDNRRGCNADS
jgi:8-oxo-dGTP pyrophosphatase MutT (NUDIX family)